MTEEELKELKQANDGKNGFEFEKEFTESEAVEAVENINRIIGIFGISKIADVFYPHSDKDAYIVPKGEALFFAGNRLLNGYIDVDMDRELNQKARLVELLVRRDEKNRYLLRLTGERLSIEKEEQFTRERDAIQEAIFNLLNPPKASGQPQPEAPELPQKLNIDKARALITKTVEAGFITVEAGQYKWNREKVLLAYYAVKATTYLGLKKKDKANACWKPFENLFNVTNLKGAKADYEKYHTDFQPTGSNEIDTIFEADTEGQK